MHQLGWEIVILVVILAVMIRGCGKGVEPIKNKEEANNFIEVFRIRAKEYPDHTAVQVKKGGKLLKTTYREYLRYCERFAGVLQKLGLKVGDRICLIGYNSFPWFVTHLGSMMAGCIPVGIYPTSGREQCEYIVGQCQPKHLFAENGDQLAKFLEILYSEDNPIESVSMLRDPPTDETIQASIFRWNQLIDHTKGYDPVKIDRKSVATLINTSGSTTGNPKSTIVTHGQLLAQVKNLTERLGGYKLGDPLTLEMGKERILSYLPANHIASQTIDIYLPICIAATVHIAQPKVLRSKGKLGAVMREVKPTIFAGVPRVWEKIAETVEARCNKLDYKTQLGMDLLGGITSLPSKYIKNKVGLDRSKICFTMGAPLLQETKNYFGGWGINVYDVYGLSETAGPITVSRPDLVKAGSVGKPLVGVRVKINKKKTDREGEILVKGDCVTTGYFGDPQKTGEIFSKRGWMRTGDIGYLDNEGYLFISGREKDIIVTSGGENVSPGPIENRLKAEIPIISEAVIVGDGKKYLAVLLAPKLDILPDGERTVLFTKEVKEILQDIGSNASTIIEAEDDKAIQKFLKDKIALVNDSAPSHVHQIKKWALLPHPLTQQDGFLTPTMKVKRKAVVEKYQKLVDNMFADKDLKNKS